MSENGHRREDYLRSRYAKKGIEGFMPRDALELILGYAIKGDKLYLAIDGLFAKYPDIWYILNASREDLLEIPGMNSDAASLLAMLPQLFQTQRRLLSENSSLYNFKTVCEFFIEQFRGVKTEQFKVACLNDNFSVERCFTISMGSPTGVNVNVNRMLQSVAKTGCKRCVAAHNHPGGNCVASAKDTESTLALINAFEGIGVTLLDHIVIGREGAKSIIGRGDGEIVPIPKF